VTDAGNDAKKHNELLWRHYQVSDPGVFGGATARLDGVAREVLRRCSSRPTVLTIGIGDGYLERRLRDAHCEVHAVDPDAETVARLRSEGIAAEAAFLESLPYADATFDIVVASEVLEHLTQEQGDLGLAQVQRVLRPRGWFVGTVPFREQLEEQQIACPHCGSAFHRWGHCRSFDRDTLRSELDQWFTVERLDCRTFVSFHGRSFTRRMTGAARWLLGRFGSRYAYPHLFFVCRKP